MFHLNYGRRLRGIIAAAGIALLSSASTLPAVAQAASDSRHVLLISVDGLHASDLSQWVSGHPQSHLAALAGQGTTYSSASSSAPSDSFPGLLAMVTGGTPKATGVFYDNSYSRELWAPGSNCVGAPGANTVYDESIDVTQGGSIPLFTTIDPSQLPMGMVGGKCVPIYPHSFLKTNTIFNVAHQAGLYTAWSDKHPAYEIVRGPSNTGAEDLFTPEINNPADPTGTSVAATEGYDQLKVQAVLNEIDGKSSDGNSSKPVPAIFGMNFQSVSVAQKLVDSYSTPGGYMPSTLAFTSQITDALNYVDGAIGSMVSELQAKGLMGSTELIVTAKHGQSPIDPSKLQKIGDQVTTVLTNAGIAIAQNTTDDIALVWLKDQSQTAAAVAALEKDKAGANTARIDYVLSGGALADRFGSPSQNDRTPDLIVQPIPGTIYTHSSKKVAEHGGFAPDDTHIAMLVVNGGHPETRALTVPANVRTAQVAPTILAYVGLDPSRLQAVQAEHTTALPQAGS